MTFPVYPSTAFIDGVTRLAPVVLNIWRGWFTAAIDMGEGGVYVPSTPIIIGGAGITLDGTTQRVGLTSRRITRYQSLAGNSLSANWDVNTTTATHAWQNTGAGGLVWLELDNLPDGATLDAVTLRYDGANGHSNDPVTDGGTLIMPQLTVYAADSTNTLTQLAQVNDSTVARADYEAAHSIEVTGIDHTIDLSANTYVLSFLGETGADFIAGAQILSVATHSIVTEYPEW